MRLVLIGNYAPDRQQSMLRFGAMLAEQWRRRGLEVIELRPVERVLRAARLHATHGLGKWLAYFDKYVLAPRQLRAQVAQLTVPGTVVHVVDHSNAIYVPVTKAAPWVVTCHDLLAVRGALGEDTDCPASVLGRRLQAAIVRGLGRASAIAADSTNTLCDLQRLVRGPGSQPRKVILLGQNHPYQVLPRAVARERLRPLTGVPWDAPFLVHVGSNLRRKNKVAVWRVFEALSAEWPGHLVFCGAPVPEDIAAAAAARGLSARVHACPAPDNAQLEAIYNLAHALVYPSRCEGFGWPIIEAQACGCPVVCSDRTSLPEVAGYGAFVHGLDDEAGMVASVRRLADGKERAMVVAQGHANLSRFTTAGMIDSYGLLYETALAPFG